MKLVHFLVISDQVFVVSKLKILTLNRSFGGNIICDTLSSFMLFEALHGAYHCPYVLVYQLIISTDRR